MASALSFTQRDLTPIGPSRKLRVGTVTLANPHDATGDLLDLTTYFPTECIGGWAIDETDGYMVNYNRAAAGAPATGRIHAYWGDYNGGADGPLTTAAGEDLHLVIFEMAFLGY